MTEYALCFVYSFSAWNDWPIEVQAIDQNETFEAWSKFARARGVIPVPEVKPWYRGGDLGGGEREEKKDYFAGRPA